MGEIHRGDRAWDSLENAGSLSYQRLAGDHAIVQTQEMTVDTPVIELDSLYLLDSNRKLHLLRPYLIGTNCSQCGTFSIFHIDRFLNRSLSMKSIEHGHTIDAPNRCLGRFGPQVIRHGSGLSTTSWPPLSKTSPRLYPCTRSVGEFLMVALQSRVSYVVQQLL